MFIRLVLLAASLMLVTGCSDREGATRTLDGMGFSNIELYAPSLFSGCGKDDSANHPFSALNAAKKPVSGTVCCGGPLSLKGCTVRF